MATNHGQGAAQSYLSGAHVPTLEELNFTKHDLDVARVSRAAVEAHVHGLLHGRAFNELVRGREPRVEAIWFAMELTRRVWDWRAERDKRWVLARRRGQTGNIDNR
jgi:hypothetical protein